MRVNKKNQGLQSIKLTKVMLGGQVNYNEKSKTKQRQLCGFTGQHAFQAQTQGILPRQIQQRDNHNAFVSRVCGYVCLPIGELTHQSKVQLNCNVILRSVRSRDVLSDSLSVYRKVRSDDSFLEI
eukprot:TRINITY_DN199552_c0_g1_i2.p1 TRINITY_DN199552_c0_g1~~TRINITY_DN199552_c0_g1_i2.p1  ORF type:complete len:146 (-),score=2.39 TRINITY_DN199552_c0_g1_i2:237-611(-)